MPFKALAIGDRGTRSKHRLMRYCWIQQKEHRVLMLTIPLDAAASASWTAGDKLQMQFGDGAHAGKFALARREKHSRSLGSRKTKEGKVTAHILRLPELPPLARAFPGDSGALEAIDADPAGGVLVFQHKP